jgi:putative phosphoribosyl transferase
MNAPLLFPDQAFEGSSGPSIRREALSPELSRRALSRKSSVTVPAGGVLLPGELEMPLICTGLVVIAHGPGSDRFCPGNRSVAAALHREGIGTLMLDFWPTDSQEPVPFDPALYVERVAASVRWLSNRGEARGLKIGCYGSSTGGAAVIGAAAGGHCVIDALVCQGATLNLPPGTLEKVHPPTLLIAAGHDTLIACRNNEALFNLRCEKQLRLVTGATHLFEEPGTLERLTCLVTEWFLRHLGDA